MIGRWALALIAAGACGTDHVDLGGTYRVDRDAGSKPCGVDQPDPNAPAFLIFRKDADSQYFVYDGCTDQAGAMCPIVGSVLSSFPEPIDRGWRGRLSSAVANAGRCGMSYFEQTAVLNGNLLTIDVHSYQDTVDLADEMCQPDEAERRGATMPCRAQSRIEATKL